MREGVTLPGRFRYLPNKQETENGVPGIRRSLCQGAESIQCVRKFEVVCVSRT